MNGSERERERETCRVKRLSLSRLHVVGGGTLSDFFPTNIHVHMYLPSELV